MTSITSADEHLEELGPSAEAEIENDQPEENGLEPLLVGKQETDGTKKSKAKGKAKGKPKVKRPKNGAKKSASNNESDENAVAAMDADAEAFEDEATQEYDVEGSIEEEGENNRSQVIGKEEEEESQGQRMKTGKEEKEEDTREGLSQMESRDETKAPKVPKNKVGNNRQKAEMEYARARMEEEERRRRINDEVSKQNYEYERQEIERKREGERKEAASGGQDTLVDLVSLLLGLLPVLMLCMYEIFMLMLFLFQLQGYVTCKNGESCFRARVIAAGVAGMLFAVTPGFMLLKDIGKEFFSWLPFTTRVGLLFLHVAFATLFLVIICLPIESKASLVSIATELRFRDDCSNGKLLQVSEDLTYSLHSGFTTTAQRVLHNQAEPNHFTAEWVGPSSTNEWMGNHSVVVRKVKTNRPGKWMMDYESGQLTTVHLQFEKLVSKLDGASFTLRLHYTARPYGDEGECLDGGAVCAESTTRSTVFGWWEVPGADEVPSTVSVKGCTVNPGCSDRAWELPLGPVPVKNRVWDLRFYAPTAVGIGSDSCPLAWSIGSRNIWWVLTGVCLFIASLICLCLVYSNSSGDKSIILCALAIMGCCVLLAIVFFMFAMLSDFWASKRTA